MHPTDAFSRFPGQAWGKVLSKANKAVVFLDEPCAESLHWSFGGEEVGKFLEAGARNIKGFSSFESGGENEPKAVFVVSTPLKGRTADVIKDVLSLSKFRYCVVFTAVPHSLHLSLAPIPTSTPGSGHTTTATTSEPEACPVFEQFEEKLCEWMGDMNYTAEVLHVQVVFAPLNPQLLLVPAFADFFPLLEGIDLAAINQKKQRRKLFASLAEVDAGSLPLQLQFRVRALALALDGLLEFCDVREESFAVGAMSRLIAGELAALPRAKNRRKAAGNKASVVFVDRTMDLTGAVGHHGDNLVEKMLSVLPPFPGHVTDVQVDMLELTHLQHTPDVQGVLAPGCLAHTQSATARLLWETMLVTKQKEAVMEVRRQLVEAASKENLPIKMSLGRVTGEQLMSYVRLFRDSWEALQSHCAVLQLGLATAHTLLHPALTHWDSCLAFERLLLQALEDSELADVLKQLLPLIKSSDSGSDSGSGSGSESRLSVDELLMLLVYLYSLAQESRAGGAQGQIRVEKVENELIGALTLLLTQQTSLSPLWQGITGASSPEDLTMERAHRAVECVFETLRELSRARDHLKQLRSVYSAGDNTHQAMYRPFLKQVLDEIFSPGRAECPDIEHTSGGLTDLLKTGFSMFMKVNRPHPSDHPLLVLVLVGGVTPSELRLIRETVSAHKAATQVLVISTRLLKPVDVPQMLFNTDRLTPDIGV